MTSNPPERINLSYQHPSMIDRDTPAEVRETVLVQLLDVGPKLQELVEASTRQIRNAVLDDLLEHHHGDLDVASAYLTEWENGDAKGALDRLHRLGGLIEKATRDAVDECVI